MLRILIILLFLLSCSSSRNYQKRDLDHYYLSETVSRYFLSDLPAWANFSSVGHCKRDPHIKYLDFLKINRGLSLSYDKSVQLQLLLNQQYREALKKIGDSYLPLEEEDRLFYEGHDKIKSDLFSFTLPTFNKISLVWVDPAISNEAIQKRLSKLFEGEALYQGHPVMISLCLSSENLNQYILENRLADKGAKGISAELYTVFDEEFNNRLSFGINLTSFLKDREITLYLPSESPAPPVEFIGKFKVLTY